MMDVFDKYDDDGSGLIDKKELLDAMGELGMTITSSQADMVITKYGGEGAEELNRAQFKELVQDLQEQQNAQRGRRSSVAAVATSWHRFLPVWKYQEQARNVYQNKWVQMFVALMILGNFFVNILEKEIDPFPADMQRMSAYWEGFDVAFNIIFLFEIILNMWSMGGPYKSFWNSGWNCFDFFVVFVGVMLMSGAVPSDSPLANLKMMRAFRVFRLFKRIKSLNKVVTALLLAIPGYRRRTSNRARSTPLATYCKRARAAAAF